MVQTVSSASRIRRILKRKGYSSTDYPGHDEMGMHSHTFVDKYAGLVGFGMDRQTDENTVMYYLQKFSDDEVIRHLIPKLPDSGLEEIFNLINRLLKEHFSETEYHQLFLKDNGR